MPRISVRMFAITSICPLVLSRHLSFGVGSELTALVANLQIKFSRFHLQSRITLYSGYPPAVLSVASSQVIDQIFVGPLRYATPIGIVLDVSFNSPPPRNPSSPPPDTSGVSDLSVYVCRVPRAHSRVNDAALLTPSRCERIFDMFKNLRHFNCSPSTSQDPSTVALQFTLQSSKSHERSEPK
ncbi:hypothetical protein B0H13DRAFT_2306564 [Mycena leptocephala]|nr:hypothetical protein B0H13DRAFT_2306564 [Mycena leptocephala]